MSDPMTDGPTEEELRAYLESLRAAQPVEIVVQAFGILATAAEVKLGLADARVLIDGMGALLEATADNLPEQITSRMRETVRQLQMAQVQAEQEQSQVADPGEQVTDGADATAEPSPQPPPQQQPPQPGGGADPASRLWIPGRD